jgi:hypothetical protein
LTPLRDGSIGMRIRARNPLPHFISTWFQHYLGQVIVICLAGNVFDHVSEQYVPIVGICVDSARIEI